MEEQSTLKTHSSETVSWVYPVNSEHAPGKYCIQEGGLLPHCSHYNGAPLAHAQKKSAPGDLIPPFPSHTVCRFTK